MKRSLRIGLGYGILATLVMTFFMLLSVMMGISPMPAPIPVALVKLVVGELPKQALIPLGMIAHFAYGSLAGILFAYALERRANVWKGLAWGVVLWMIMQLVFLPLLGWGVFGTAHTPKIAAATLMLHLIYGGILGGGVRWHYDHVSASPGVGSAAR